MGFARLQHLPAERSFATKAMSGSSFSFRNKKFGDRGLSGFRNFWVKSFQDVAVLGFRVLDVEIQVFRA